MAASETSKPGFWLVVLRVCVCVLRTCVGIIILSVGCCVLMYVTRVLHEWRLVTCLSRSCLRRCVLWSWLVLSLQCVTPFYLARRTRERERELKPTLCAAQLREGQSRTYNAHGEMKPTRQMIQSERAPRHNAQQTQKTHTPYPRTCVSGHQHTWQRGKQKT